MLIFIRNIYLDIIPLPQSRKVKLVAGCCSMWTLHTGLSYQINKVS